MRRPLVPALALVVLTPLVACSPGESETAAPAGSGVRCSYPSAGAAAKPVEAPKGDGVLATGTTTLTLTLDGKEVKVTMDRAAAPCTINSITSLASQGWFDDTRCHRLTTDGIFVLQCGDPSGTGSGGPGYSFDDELDGAKKLAAGPNHKSVVYPRGIVAMANAGPNTNGSQFFLVWQDSPLKPDYTVVGQMDEKSTAAVAEIAAQGVSADRVSPNAPALISSAKVG